MKTVESGFLAPEHTGFAGENRTFRFDGGGQWRQKAYFWLSQPKARVLEDAGRFFLEVVGSDPMIEVVPGP